MDIVFLCIGLLVGFLLCWFYRNGRDAQIRVSTSGELHEIQKQNAVIAAHVQRLEMEKSDLQKKITDEESRIRSLTADLARTQQMLIAEEDNNEKAERKFENVANKIFKDHTAQ